MRLYGDLNGAQTMLYLTCTTITSVDLAHYGVSRAKDWVSVDCGTKYKMIHDKNVGVAYTRYLLYGFSEAARKNIFNCKKKVAKIIRS